MNETEIRGYAQLMKELELTGLEITDGNTKVRLERSLPAVGMQAVYPAGEAYTANAAAHKEAAPAAASVQTGYSSVTSPIVGMFYAAPAENEAPYVKVGDRVQKGQTLCIIEAMKLMNEINAEEDGVISQICATNGQVVEYGTELFRITRE